MFAAPITKVAHNFFRHCRGALPELVVPVSELFGGGIDDQSGHGSEFHNGNTMVEDEGGSAKR